jgi:hypothetical protein
MLLQRIDDFAVIYESAHLETLLTASAGAAEADLIRGALRIKRKPHHTPDQFATITKSHKRSKGSHIRQKRKSATRVAKTDRRENLSFKRASTGEHGKKGHRRSGERDLMAK